MYQAYKCRRCNHVFYMDDKKRKEFLDNGGCIIGCPECGSWGLDEIKLGKLCSGCINPNTLRFLSCVDCTFEPFKYNCNAWRQDSGNYQVITTHI